MISWSDFEKIDIRVGTIMHAEPFPRAKNPSYRLKIDFGELGIKQSSAQLTVHYRADDLVNKQVIAVVNFAPKNIAGFMSECLVLGVYDENNNVVLLQADMPVMNGMKIG
jgi:tRNA-binding protein